MENNIGIRNARGALVKIMLCPECKKDKQGHFEKQSITLRKRCIDCFNTWAEKPENDPDYKKFKIELYHSCNITRTVYAKSEKELEDEGLGLSCDNCYRNFEIESIEEVEKK